MEDIARELEKAAKSLTKMTGNEVLFEDDAVSGRARIIYDAMEKREDDLNLIVKEVANQEDGARRLMRSLNNLRTINNPAALLLARIIFDELEARGEWTEDTRVQKIGQMLDDISPLLHDGPGWLDDRCAQILDESDLSEDLKFALWFKWCGATLRACSSAQTLIEKVGTRRPRITDRNRKISLRNMVKGGSGISWEQRSAAVYMLIRSNLISLEDAQTFTEEGFIAFPLEALEGVELLQLAIEHDAAKLAQTDSIQKRLSQIRIENGSLRDMPLDDFIDASNRIFTELSALPKTKIELAETIPQHPRREMLILTAFLDDAQRCAWLTRAVKSGQIKHLASAFYSNICEDNPMMCIFGDDLAQTLVENCSADAMIALQFHEASESQDHEKIRTLSESLLSFCRN